MARRRQHKDASTRTWWGWGDDSTKTRVQERGGVGALLDMQTCVSFKLESSLYYLLVPVATHSHDSVNEIGVHRRRPWGWKRKPRRGARRIRLRALLPFPSFPPLAVSPQPLQNLKTDAPVTARERLGFRRGASAAVSAPKLPASLPLPGPDGGKK
jgi:hypothetical protein